MANREPMTIDISIICPVYNEQANLIPLIDRLRKSIPSVFSWEILLIDDGSTDDSWMTIKTLCKNDKRLHGVHFSRNHGHQIALTAGYDLAKGRAAITMDSDLQHPPESIPQMLDLWKAGYDIIFAIRDDSKHLSWFKRSTSRLFYAVYKKITNVDIIEGAADFRLLDYKVLIYLRQYQERDRFLRGMIADMGFRRTVMVYTEPARQHGKSTYSPWKMMRLAFIGIVSFSAFPLRLLMINGLIISLVSICYALVIVWQKFFLGIPSGQASIFVGIFFIGGVQLISIGILGEYIRSIFKEVKARPLYFIQEIINND